MFNARFCWLFIFLFMLGSCAQVVAPTGGSKDETPPKVLRTYPSNKTTHFSAPKIVIQFDEFITLNSPGEQVIISPPLEVKPEFSLDHKKLVIDLKNQPLKNNVTYTINFGNAIGDLHENNILQNFTYVFGTGAALDSMKVVGLCLDAINNEPVKKQLVGLYRLNGFNDSVLYKEKPIYFTRCKPDGTFEINNIPDSVYKVVSFNDENNNLKYNQNEVIGFLNNDIKSSDTINRNITLYTYKPDPFFPAKLLDTFSSFPGRFNLVTYKSLPVLFKGTPDISSLYIWKDRFKNHIDSVVLFTKTQDTLLSGVYNMGDSVAPFTIKTRRGFKPAPFYANCKKNVELNDSITVTFNFPTISYDTSRIKIYEDTIQLNPSYLGISKDGRAFNMAYSWQEAKRYVVDMKDSAFKDIYGRLSKGNTKFNWTAKSLKDYSSLKLFIQNPFKDQFILQLVDESETKIYKERILNSGATIYFDYLQAGTFKVKFILDANKNGVWDTGDYLIKKQPERVYYYSEPIVLRAFWDIEQSINMEEVVK